MITKIPKEYYGNDRLEYDEESILEDIAIKGVFWHTPNTWGEKTDTALLNLLNSDKIRVASAPNDMAVINWHFSYVMKEQKIDVILRSDGESESEKELLYGNPPTGHIKGFRRR